MLKSVYRFFSSKFQTVFLDYPVNLKPRYGHGRAPHPELMAIINDNRYQYKHFLLESLKFQDQISEIKSLSDEENINQPTWNNAMLPGLDIITLYTMLAIKIRAA